MTAFATFTSPRAPLDGVFLELFVFLNQSAACAAEGEEYVAAARPLQLMVGIETADSFPRATVDQTRQRKACKWQIDELIGHNEHHTVQHMVEHAVATGRRRYARAFAPRVWVLVFVLQRGCGDD